MTGDVWDGGIRGGREGGISGGSTRLTGKRGLLGQLQLSLDMEIKRGIISLVDGNVIDYIITG